MKNDKYNEEQAITLSPFQTYNASVLLKQDFKSVVFIRAVRETLAVLESVGYCVAANFRRLFLYSDFTSCKDGQFSALAMRLVNFINAYHLSEPARITFISFNKLKGG